MYGKSFQFFLKRNELFFSPHFVDQTNIIGRILSGATGGGSRVVFTHRSISANIGGNFVGMSDLEEEQCNTTGDTTDSEAFDASDFTYFGFRRHQT